VPTTVCGKRGWDPPAPRLATPSETLEHFGGLRLARHNGVTRLPLFCALLVTGCAASPPVEIAPDFSDSKADGLASTLKLRDDHSMDINEPSDLAFGDGKLYAVSDRQSKIYEIDVRDGNAKDEIDVEAQDLEALAIDNEGRFYIADEADGKVWRVSQSGERKESFAVDTDDGNSGIEGIAFDDDGHMLIANEKDPARIIELDASDGHETERETLDFADDLSALAFNSEDGLLYALSDIEHKLFRLDSDFRKITSWKLPLEHPEGLAFDGHTVYVASDSEERLYVFELD
jgi:uncharacterized protein YjiK